MLSNKVNCILFAFARIFFFITNLTTEATASYVVRKGITFEFNLTQLLHVGLAGSSAPPTPTLHDKSFGPICAEERAHQDPDS